MQALCQVDSLADAFAAQLDEFLADDGAPAVAIDYARRLVNTFSEHREAIDAALQSAAENWQLSRMALVDRNVLRVAACELSHSHDVPPAVAINEAVDIAGAFGSAESGGFVNGVLDALRKNIAANSAAGAASHADPPEATAQSSSGSAD